MDEDAELLGLSDQPGPKAAGGAIPAGALSGDQTQRKVPLERESETKQVLDRAGSQEPPLLPHAQSGVWYGVLWCVHSCCDSIFSDL